jgi:hypothetical protein
VAQVQLIAVAAQRRLALVAQAYLVVMILQEVRNREQQDPFRQAAIRVSAACTYADTVARGVAV